MSDIGSFWLFDFVSANMCYYIMKMLHQRKLILCKQFMRLSTMRDVMKARYVKSPKLLLRAFQSNTQRSGHKAEGAAL